ncbi:MAG: 2,3-bisphosphoglycerate-dependent phosphoglycerate mutase [Candidatus Marinimicrobia bacterium]|nr:2,3-bisphosphoglycerate-dependent phosphoglycerate mutase [Candidatus Neomarinimicrobiota bacterium]|tara:strand:+ start:5826 stop:6488 length:663 start_codon:yes stop_codon:yes gene_type:complete
MKLILVRHGQSIYNLENRFTGWKDVDLTDKGRNEAVKAGKLLNKNNLVFDYAYTSNLTRAQETLSIILKQLNSQLSPIKNEALNERDYGDLIGRNKSDAAKEFGEDQVQIWRRSYDIPPPGGESLKMTCDRTLPYFKKILKLILKGNNIIIAAHGNSIRAIVKELLNYSSELILKTEIGWCEPWIFEFNKLGEIEKLEILKIDPVSNSNLPELPTFINKN